MNNQKAVRYEIDQKDKMKFVIKNYSKAKPFSSFFPGISGLMGIPLWCFYVNRGQCIASFGTESKDGAIMEFQPANKSYRIVGTQGFRTFIKCRKGSEQKFYEPFQDTMANQVYEIENTMTIRPYDLEIEEINQSLGLAVKIKYFTIPNEPFAALARETTVTNLSGEPVEIELLDGLPVITPYGLADFYVKGMSRTMEAWTYVENMENSVPFYRLKVLPNDSTEVIPVEKGNFYISFLHDKQGGVKLTAPVIDPTVAFGHVLDFSYPQRFNEEGFKVDEVQHFENRTPCALGFVKFSLGAKEEQTLYTLIGHTEGVHPLNSYTPRMLEDGYFEQKSAENAKLIQELMDKAFVHSAFEAFDSYSRQNFLDNILRGGYPLTLEADGKKDVLYVYSRRHGDLERDYNSFRLMPTFYSQGNGAYRDINQNRRNDVWFNPDVGISNIHYFMNLIQLDGYNPLVVKGLSYIYEKSEENIQKLKKLVPEQQAEKLRGFLSKPFIPYTLICHVQQEGIELKASLETFIHEIILGSRKIEEAEHGEGYWSDHWFYNTDLLESYAGVFPDKIKELLIDKKIFNFYDDIYRVVPRKEKYVTYKNNELRQFGAVKKVPEKMQMLSQREVEPNKVRVQYGKGDIYSTSLYSKLLTLCVCKMAALDAHGVGIEMEADKPNWDDATNGMPALFGSSTSETFELLRLILLLKQWNEKYNLEKESILLPEEIHEFMTKVSESLKQTLDEDTEEGNFRYWDAAYSAKEAYREKVLYGIDGKEATLSLSTVNAFFDLCITKLNRAKEKAYNKALGIFNTYFINKPVEYVMENGCIKVKRFEQKPLPPFLEGQVHALKIEKDQSRADQLYRSIRESELYDEKLGMYKVNGSLKDTPMEIGRLRAFTPGWLENESIFLHMEYKYLLELVKSGVYEGFYTDMKTALIPFQKPEVYGRSIFENSSFVASSSNPDETVHGNGFVARLSGTTSEFYHMLLVMAVGKEPFTVNENGELELRIKPALHHSLFTQEDKKVILNENEGPRELLLEKNTFSINFLGRTVLVFHNPNGRNTYGGDGAEIRKIELSGDKTKAEIAGSVISQPFAGNVRDGVYHRIDVWLE
ncbi:MAG: hypothetical protein N2484_01465 [Clostridia bacterium]|nr:hypothetical protein [Clostridia bacterium]